jgi:MFS family permease
MPGPTTATQEQSSPPPRVRSAAWLVVVAVASAVRGGWRRITEWNQGSGASRSGLARLVEVHALQTAGDAFVTVALAGSLFFEVPTNQARTRVGLYLLVAMAPFALLAPVLGPLLDRFRHGRRFALAATMLARATLALVIGRALAGGDLTTTEALALYPAALGVLVAQKTYSIARSATVPRVLPEGMTLVQANSRLTLTGVFAPALAGGVALGLVQVAGHLWALRVGAVVYLLATIFALRLPRWADGGAEVRRQEGHPAVGSVLRLGQVDPEVGGVLRSAAALRWLAGFLLFFGAFVVQEDSIAGMPRGVALAALAVGIGAGNFVGTLLGARTAAVAAPRLAVLLLALTAGTTLLTAVDFGLLTVFGVAVVSAAAAAVAKLGLDATIQRRVPEHVRTSTFARSETTLQLAWVAGGGVGIVLPTQTFAGFLVATGVLVFALVVAVRFVRSRPQAQPAQA